MEQNKNDKSSDDPVPQQHRQHEQPTLHNRLEALQRESEFVRELSQLEETGRQEAQRYQRETIALDNEIKSLKRSLSDSTNTEQKFSSRSPRLRSFLTLMCRSIPSAPDWSNLHVSGRPIGLGPCVLAWGY